MADGEGRATCVAPGCEEPPADDARWCDWHSGLLYDHRQLVDAPQPGNHFFHARDKQDCPACGLGADPREGLCAAPACEERATLDADHEDYAPWCGLHGDLLLDHRLDELEGTDNHFHPVDRAQCPACNGWSQP